MDGSSHPCSSEIDRRFLRLLSRVAYLEDRSLHLINQHFADRLFDDRKRAAIA